MKIIMNTTPLLYPLTGIGNCVYYLSKYLPALDQENSYVYYCGGKVLDVPSPISQTPISSGNMMRLLREPVKRVPGVDRLARHLRSAWIDFQDEKLSGKEMYDLYFEPNFVFHKLSARRRIATVYDLSFLIYPQWVTGEAKYQQKKFLDRIKLADTIITDSFSIKQEICDILRVPEKKVCVIYNGVDHDLFRICPSNDLELFRKRVSLPDNFILFVGSIQPRKNLYRLLKAYTSLPAHMRRDVKLVLAGLQGWSNREVFELINKEPDNIIYLGYLDVEDLPYLYNLATIHVCPSIYEGFSLPPLEALCCGVPSVLSDIPVHRELYSDCAEFCDPLVEESIAQALENLLNDNKRINTLKDACKERSKDFSWEKCAREHLNVFNGIVHYDKARQ